MGGSQTPFQGTNGLRGFQLTISKAWTRPFPFLESCLWSR